MRRNSNMKPIPEYEGQWCTSACYNDYDCPHEERFEEEMGIRHVDVKSNKETTHYEVVVVEGKPMTKVDNNVFLK